MGESGPKGDIGPIGPPGLKGEKGERGPPGLVTPAGVVRMFMIFKVNSRTERSYLYYIGSIPIYPVDIVKGD